MKVAFSHDTLTQTGREVAQMFAETFEPARQIVWHVDGNFHFVDGNRTYGVRPGPSGWQIVIVNEE